MYAIRSYYAHVVAVDRLLSKRNEKSLEVFNIGTGRGVSVLELIRTFEQTNQVKLNYTVAERRIGDVEQVWADTRRANNVLGWKAAHSLEEALSSACRITSYNVCYTKLLRVCSLLAKRLMTYTGRGKKAVSSINRTFFSKRPRNFSDARHSLCGKRFMVVV